MSKADQLATALDEFLGVSPEVEAAAVVSADGLPIASALPPHVEEDRLAAMSAALLTLGERAAEGLGKGELAQVFVEGDVGHVILMSAGHSAVLVAVSSKEAKVGLVLFEMRKTANKVSDIMNQDYPDAVPTSAPIPTADPTTPHVPEAAPAPYTPAPLPYTPAPLPYAPAPAPVPEPATPNAGVFSPDTSNGGVVGSVSVAPTGAIGAPAQEIDEPASPPEPTTTTETESSVSSWT